MLICIPAIRSLRNQLTIRHNEAQLSSDDKRIVLVRDWLEISPGAEDLFEYLDTNIPVRTYILRPPT